MALGVDLYLAAQTGTYSTSGPSVSLSGGSAFAGFQTLSAAGAVSTSEYYCTITDASGNSLVWKATYSSTGPTLTRSEAISSIGAIANSAAVSIYVWSRAQKPTTVGLALMEAASTDAQRALLRVGPGMKNRIIGGNFSTNPWQRGTTFTGVANGAYTADLWMVSHSMDGAVDVLRTEDAPTVVQTGVFCQHCWHLDVTTVDASLAAGQYLIVRPKIEALANSDLGFGQSGTRYVTLSFWHKHTKTGTYCVSIINNATTRSYIAEYSQAVSDTWEFVSLTIPVDTTGTWSYTTATEAIRLYFVVAVGSTYTSTPNSWLDGHYWATSNQVNALGSTANNFKLALVQLEAGEVATPFEYRHNATEAELCKRSFRKQSVWVGTSTAPTCFAIDMRATPTITGGGTGFTYATNSTADTLVCYQTTAGAQTLEMSA